MAYKKEHEKEHDKEHSIQVLRPAPSVVQIVKNQSIFYMALVPQKVARSFQKGLFTLHGWRPHYEFKDL
jgi:hypothetical protein